MNLPIWCTEYDFAAADENDRADGLEKFYRTAFSHPSVEGILMWGFWENSHWRDDCHLVNADWTLNEAGRRYEALMNEWTTKDANTSDSEGKANFRGFHGSYEITLNVPGVVTQTSTIELEPGQTTAEYTLVLNCDQPCDLNNDCRVDIYDFDIFATDWLSPYNFVDFAFFAQDWGI